MARRHVPRKAPKVRTTPDLKSINFEKKDTKDPKKLKCDIKNQNRRIEGFLDVEVEVSSDGVDVSSDEECEDSQKDLSGFIANDSSRTNSPENRAFYRKSLLSPEHGGLGKHFGPQYHLSKLRYPQIQESSEDSSMIDFVVPDDVVEYAAATQGILDDFTDQSQEIPDKNFGFLVDIENPSQDLDNFIQLDSN